MIDAFYGDFTFLKFLSILAFVTTVGLFFCGIPICRQIWKRRDTAEISGAPFLMGVLGGTCWCVYGWLKQDQTVKYVTGAQIVLYSTYTVFYWFMTKKKLWITVKIVALLVICASLVAMVHFFGHKVFHPLGIICMALNIGDFAAPLAGLRVVIRRGATSTLPLPLCIANFMVSSEWFLYGLLVWDFYLITPNGIGSLLAFAQLILFVVLPRKPMQRAPFLCLYDQLRACCACCMDNSLDLESAAVVPAAAEKKEPITIGIHRMSSRMSNKHRWSNRVITNVVGEVENVIHKVHGGDPFGYKLNKEDDGSTDSGTLTPVDEKPVAPTAAANAETQTSAAPAASAPTAELAPETEVQLGIFEQSARSIGARISELVAQRGRVAFARSHGSTKAVEEDQEQFGIEPCEESAEEEEGQDDDRENGGQISINGDGSIQGEQLVFPLTINDASQLLRLSRRLSGRRKLHGNKHNKNNNGNNKLPAGFGCSLQAGHFRALRRHQQQQGVATAAGEVAGGLARIEEQQQQLEVKQQLAAMQQLAVDDDQLQQIKRAKSAPNIYGVDGAVDFGKSMTCV